MIEILEVISSIHTTLARIAQINTILSVTTTVSYTVNLVSEILPELDEVSEINLEEV
jgi:hypothetical protein